VRMVRVEIGEVRVRGFGPIDGERIRAAAARELERLLAADEVSPHGTSRAHVDAGRVPLPPTASADDVGVAIGRAVQRGLA
jgi:hypothetical protein